MYENPRVRARKITSTAMRAHGFIVGSGFVEFCIPNQFLEGEALN